MSTTDTSQPVSDRVVAVHYNGWPALGGDVQLELGRTRTVLVGRNAAGKSLLLESLELSARMAVGDGSYRAHSIKRPKERLRELSTRRHGRAIYSTTVNEELARTLDLELCASRCRAFAELRSFVERLFPPESSG